MLATALATSPSSWESSGSSPDDLAPSGSGWRPCHHPHNHHYHHQQLETPNNKQQQQPDQQSTTTPTISNNPSSVPVVVAEPTPPPAQQQQQQQPSRASSSGSSSGGSGSSSSSSRSVHQIQVQLQLQHKQRQQSYVYPKLQLVQIDDAWYALNQTCLQIYQQLQMCGTAQLMPVDVVPLHKVCAVLYPLSPFSTVCNFICHPDIIITAKISDSRLSGVYLLEILMEAGPV